MEFCLSLQRAESMAARGTLTETRARELIGEVSERTSGDTVEFFTAEGWLRGWLRGKEISKAEGTHTKYAHAVGSFVAHLGARARLNIAAIAREHGKAVFEAGAEWRGAILFAYFTGARLQDVANMTWQAIDLPAHTITFRAKKGGRLVTIPMHAELESHLLALPAPDIGKAFVFPMLAGGRTSGRSGLSMTFARIMVRAGVKGEVLRAANEGGKGRTVRSLTFHSLRHSFNSAMANAGVSQEVRMKLTGHLSAEMNKGYTHLELEPLRAAVAVIPGVGKRH